MGPITRICKFGLAATLLAAPALATAPAEDLIGRYASARVAEIGEQDSIALDGYLKLYKQAPESEILADRLFDSAIRAGDMATAVRAARARELRNSGNNETVLLLFADAWRAKNWNMAKLAADELSQSGNLAFMAPMLKGWLNVAQGHTADLPEADASADSFFAYYSADQRIYFDLASSRFAKAKLGLRDIANQQGDYVRDVMIAGAQTLSGKGGDQSFAEALMLSAIGTTDGLPMRVTKFPSERGLAALYGRISNALIEQEMPREGLALARIGYWISPAQPNMRLALAKALGANGLVGEALELLRHWSDAGPYRLAILEARVEMLLASKQISQAQIEIVEATERMPKSVAIKLIYARVQEEAGNTPLVISTYRTIIDTPDFAALSPRRQAGYRLLLASSLDRAGDWPSTRVELEKLLIVDPDNAEALNYLGYSLLERGIERTKATEMVKRAYAIEPASSAIADSLGWAYLLQGDAKEALPLLEKAAKNAGSEVAINEHLGDAYWTVGRRRDARYAWRIASQASEGEAAERLSRKIDVGLSATR